MEFNNMKFTDLLDNYLEAKAVYDKAYTSCTAHDRGYWLSRESGNLSEARDALNKTIETIMQQEAVI